GVLDGSLQQKGEHRLAGDGGMAFVAREAGLASPSDRCTDLPKVMIPFEIGLQGGQVSIYESAVAAIGARQPIGPARGAQIHLLLKRVVLAGIGAGAGGESSLSGSCWSDFERHRSRTRIGAGRRAILAPAQ